MIEKMVFNRIVKEIEKGFTRKPGAKRYLNFLNSGVYVDLDQFQDKIRSLAVRAVRSVEKTYLDKKSR